MFASTLLLMGADLQEFGAVLFFKRSDGCTCSKDTKCCRLRRV